MSAAVFWRTDTVTIRYVGSIGVLANSFGLLQILSPFDVTGPVIKMTIAMLSDRDVKGFMYVAGVLVVGFSAAFTISMPKSDQFGVSWDQYSGPFRSVLIVFASMLGAFDLNDYEHPEALAMFVIFAMIMVVVMLNTLIAMMGEASTAVKKNAELETLKLRARVVMDVELGLSPTQLRKDKWFPKFVQVLDPDSILKKEGDKDE